MQQRRGTAEQWTIVNPILASGEIGYETDNNRFKLGDGITVWSLLPYFVDETNLSASLEDYVPLDSLGVADGVATLDGTGKITSSQLPDIGELSQDAVDQALTAGNGITKDYDDVANTLTLAVDTTVIATRSYVDNEIAAIPAPDYTGLATELYADQAEADAIAAANSYTDAQILAIPPVDLTGYATETYVSDAVQNVVGLAPETLNTLAEIADALGDDPNAITVIQTDIGNLETSVASLETDKADTNSPTFTGLTDFQGIVDFSDAVVVGIDALPDQTGNDGKYLTTDGSNASWSEISAINAQSSVPHPFTMMG